MNALHLQAQDPVWQRLVALPRDTRDTLFLLAVIAWSVLPLAAQVPLWCSLLTAAVLLLRGWLAWQGRPLPSKWWLAALLAGSVLGTWLSYRTLLGRDAGVTLVAVLLALKTLELRARRDIFVVFFLGFFALLTNFFFSQSLLTALAMLLALLGWLTALVNAHMPVGKPPLWQAARTAGGMTLLGAPVMAALFVLFPRVAPLWGLPSDAMSGRSGLSAQMQVGQIASLALDESIAFRVRFDGDRRPPPQSMYFRGPVLSLFDGRAWLPLSGNLSARFQAPALLQVAGPATAYEVTLEPHNHPWVYVLDAAAQPPDLPGQRLSMTPELQWLSPQVVSELTRYRAQSHTQFTHGPLQRTAPLAAYTLLPGNSNPRTLALANQMRQDPDLSTALRQRGPVAYVDAALDRLRTGGYSYTLEPGVYGQHTADEFWFDRKEGFCEHIASSFVVLMRALDVPARIVTGYQGGERNPVDGFWVVRQSDAHAWAEVWLPGLGWQRVDPTSAVAPGRTGAFNRLAAPQGVIAQALNGAFGTVSPTALAHLRAAWEAVNNRWNQWVLNYSQSKQLNLLKDIGFESPSWEDLMVLLLALLVGASLVGSVWAWWDKRRQDPWLVLLKQARRRLTQAGMALPASAPPRTLAAALPIGDPAHAPAHAWLLRLEAWRYAPTVARAHSLTALQAEFKRLVWPPSASAPAVVPPAPTIQPP
ncbi:MAG: hypothetical protein RLZZ126_565 [Pseudomonadota bacterium]|jgi:transglutaminase-like putative cysteine protease